MECVKQETGGDENECLCGQVLKYEYLRNPSLVGFGKWCPLISSPRTMDVCQSDLTE